MTGERKNKNKEKLAIDPDIVRELARLLDETGLSEIEFERDGDRVRVARQTQGGASPRAPAASTDVPLPVREPTPLDPAKHPGVVTSPTSNHRCGEAVVGGGRRGEHGRSRALNCRIGTRRADDRWRGIIDSDGLGAVIGVAT